MLRVEKKMVMFFSEEFFLSFKNTLENNKKYSMYGNTIIYSDYKSDIDESLEVNFEESIVTLIHPVKNDSHLLDLIEKYLLVYSLDKKLEKNLNTKKKKNKI